MANRRRWLLTGCRQRLPSDQRGVVYIETLIAFLPVFLFFLATLQIADASAAHLIVQHAATIAARAAVVVMPDDGIYYNDPDNAQVHTFTGLRRDDIEHAADLILRANERLDRSPFNVEVAFSGGAPRATPPPPKAPQSIADFFQQLLDTSTKGDGTDQGMRELLTARVRAKYRCLVAAFCADGYAMIAQASLAYQGARYVYEPWPDSLHNEGGGHHPSVHDPGNPAPSHSNPGTNPHPDSEPTNPATAPHPDQHSAQPGDDAVADNRPVPGTHSAGESNPADPGHGTQGPNNPRGTSPVGPVSSDTNPSASASHDGTQTASNSAPTPSGTNPSQSSSADPGSDLSTQRAVDTNGLLGTGRQGSAASNGDTAQRARDLDSDQTHPEIAGVTPQAAGRSPRATVQPSSSSPPTEAHAGRPNPGHGSAATRGPPSLSAQSARSIVAGASSRDDASSPTITPQGGQSDQNTQPSSAGIVASPGGRARGGSSDSSDRANVTPRNLTELRGALPPNLRDVPIIRDPTLSGSTVRVQYTHNAHGVITGIEVRVGDGARARHIADHVNTVRTMQRYQGLSGRVRALLARVNAWFTGNPSARPGSLAWETRQEIEKLRGITDARTRALENGALTDAERAELERELASYEQQLAGYQATVDGFTSEPGRGYVAAHQDPSDAARNPNVDPTVRALRFITDLDNTGFRYVDESSLVDRVVIGQTVRRNGAVVREDRAFHDFLGGLGEDVALRELWNDGYRRIIVIKNGSNHGIDIIAIGPGDSPHMVFVEVKSYNSQGTKDHSHDLSAPQQDPIAYVRGQLSEQAARQGRYAALTAEEGRAAQLLLDWYNQVVDDGYVDASFRVYEVGISPDGVGYKVTGIRGTLWSRR